MTPLQSSAQCSSKRASARRTHLGVDEEHERDAEERFPAALEELVEEQQDARVRQDAAVGEQRQDPTDSTINTGVSLDDDAPLNET